MDRAIPKGINKSYGAQILADKYGISQNKTFAIGNDFNDTDLLEWAQSAYVPKNGRPQLKQKHIVVESNNDSGVSVALEQRKSLWD